MSSITRALSSPWTATIGLAAGLGLVGATTLLFSQNSNARLDQIDQQLRWPSKPYTAATLLQALDQLLG